jgi:hypothetical protein
MTFRSKLSRRGFLKYGSLTGVGAFLTACLSQNAPPASGAPTAAAGTTAPTVAPAANAITWKIQSGWAGNDIFQQHFLAWKGMVEEMSGGRIKIDALPVNSVTNINAAIDAVNSGTHRPDDGHERPDVARLVLLRRRPGAVREARAAEAEAQRRLALPHADAEPAARMVQG